MLSYLILSYLIPDTCSDYMLTVILIVNVNNDTGESSILTAT